MDNSAEALSEVVAVYRRIAVRESPTAAWSWSDAPVVGSTVLEELGNQYGMQAHEQFIREMLAKYGFGNIRQVEVRNDHLPLPLNVDWDACLRTLNTAHPKEATDGDS